MRQLALIQFEDGSSEVGRDARAAPREPNIMEVAAEALVNTEQFLPLVLEVEIASAALSSELSRLATVARSCWSRQVTARS